MKKDEQAIAAISLALMNHPKVVRHMQKKLRRPQLDAIYDRYKMAQQSGRE
jgi:hypothetical protein